MTRRDLSFRSPPSLSIAETATVPNPGFNGAVAWSTLQNRAMVWNGVFWSAVVPLGSDNVFLGQNRPSYVTVTTISTTSTFSYSPSSHGQVANIPLLNSIIVTFGAPTGIVEGSMYKFVLKAGDSLVRTFAWSTSFKFPSGFSPVSSASVVTGAFDIVTFLGGAANTLIYDGSSLDVR